MIAREPYRKKKRRNLPYGTILAVLLLLAAAWLHHIHRDHQKALLKHEETPQALRHAPRPEPVTTPLPQLPFKIGETSGILWNLNNHRLLWALHPHKMGPLASTTKLMTFYLARKHLSLTQTITVSPQAAGTGGSDIKMAPGNHFTVRQLLYALMLRSANDAAVQLSESTSGHTQTFVHLMNLTAKKLGMRSTHFGDPDGLSPQSRGTAWDLSIIAEQDLKDPLFRQIVATRRTSLPHNPVVQNLNGLLFMDPTVIGLKTGWTVTAGFNLVFAATRQIHGKPVTLLGVILYGQRGFPPEYRNAEKILNWGFRQAASP